MDDLADRIGLRELADRYAQAVDRGWPERAAALFSADGELRIHDAGAAEPSRVYRGRAEIRAAMEKLRGFRVTTHLVANQLVTIDRDTASGETYCLAKHIYDTGDGGRRVYVMSIRYLDTFVRENGEWRIKIRRNRVDWTEDREFTPPGQGQRD